VSILGSTQEWTYIRYINNMSKIIDTIFNHYEEPESIKIEGKDIRENVTLNPEVKKKIAEVFDETQETLAQMKHNMLAEMLFLLLMIVGLLGSIFPILITSMFIWIWLKGRGDNLRVSIKQRLGFIDGIFYTINDVAKVVDEAQNNPEFMKEFRKEVMNDDFKGM